MKKNAIKLTIAVLCIAGCLKTKIKNHLLYNIITQGKMHLLRIKLN